ncbi:AMP-binding protein [Actinomadura welshii]
MNENFATVLETVASAAGDRPAVVQGSASLSFTELERRAARLAGHLVRRGAGPGTRVAVALYNGPEYVETVFAALKAGAVPVNVNYRYREAELVELLSDAGAEAIVFDAALDGRIAAVAPELPALRTLLRVGGPGAGPVGADPYEDVLGRAEPLAETVREPGLWLLYTGGTTGRPKGVRSTHRWLYDVAVSNGYRLLGLPGPESLAELADRSRELCDGGRSLVTLPAPPLTHGTGLYSTLGTLLTGGTAVFPESRSFDPAELARLAAEHRATVVTIVGDAFARPLADVLDAAAGRGEPYDLSALDWMVSVGVLWSGEVKERLLRHGDFICRDVVAASEGGPFAISLTDRRGRAVTSRFELFPGARVLTEDGRDVVPGSGEVGMLAAPADAETAYQGDEAKTAQTFRYVDGRRYVVPGDLAALDADGTVVFKGRDSRVINTGGEKVFAEEVEQVLQQHPGVDDAYVVGVPDERWGKRIAAVVATGAAEPPTAAELMEFVGSRLARYKAPRSVVAVPELRRSPAGKADLRWARQIAETGPTETGAGSGGTRREPP